MKTRSTATYFLGMLAQIVVRAPYERQRRQNRLRVDLADGTERALLGLLFVGIGVIPAVYALTPWLDRADYRLSPDGEKLAEKAGAGLIALALLLFWRSHADLGRNWSPSLQLREEHALVTRGVYRYVRHPMYASQMVWGVAQALLLRNWIAGWAGAATFLPLYLLRVPREERMMLGQFGEEYQEYMDRTGGVLPRLESRAG